MSSFQVNYLKKQVKMIFFSVINSADFEYILKIEYLLHCENY